MSGTMTPRSFLTRPFCRCHTSTPDHQQTNNGGMEELVEVQVIEASDVEARLLVIYRGENFADAELAGTITGPWREGSRTLPATFVLQPSRHGDRLAAEAILPDPCFYSPELPFLYDLAVELRRGGEVIDAAEFSISLHPKRVVKQ